MLNFTVEKQGTHTYLVYEFLANDELDTMSLGMLTNNNIPGFAPAAIVQMDNTKYIKYNVSSRVPAAKLFDGVVSRKKLISVLSGVVNAMIFAEEYMLDSSNILLNLDYVFADTAGYETVMICLPVLNSDHRNPDLGSFFKNIICNTQSDHNEDSNHVTQILNYLNSNSTVCLNELKQLLDKLEGKAESVSKAPVVPQPDNRVKKPDVVIPIPLNKESVAPVDPINNKSKEKKKLSAKPDSKLPSFLQNILTPSEKSKSIIPGFEIPGQDAGVKPISEAPVSPVADIVDEDATVSVVGSSQNNPHLIRKKTNEKINLDKPLFHIGKDPKYADYCVSDNKAISRKHADIIIRNNDCYVVDTKSMNGTFVNSKVIPSEMEVKLEHGNWLCFADEEFEFRMY